ncbi:MAG: hypothetical protein K0U13_05470 [Chlamydiae bacterium]|nr:hypothetical protein [Chlamydiales bacterium]MCH9704221.1 hypothetical protein [Chlamydiota bacterium]
MKRFLLLFLSSTAFALPVGNPAQATLFQKSVFFDPCSVNAADWRYMFVGELHFRLGYYGDFSKNRSMDEFIFGTSQSAVAKIQIQTNAAYATANIYNWMDVFGTFGVSNIQLIRTAGENNVRGITRFSPAFSWSCGTHATFFKKGHLLLGGMGQYLRTQPEIDSYFNYSTGVQTFFNNTNSTAWEEWQVAIGPCLQFQNSENTSFAPYAAIRVSQGKFVLRGFEFEHDGIDHQLPDLKPIKYFGWALGCTLLNQDAIGVTVEGRWINETALFIEGQMQF